MTSTRGGSRRSADRRGTGRLILLFVLAGLPALAAVLIHARAGGDPGAGSAPDPRSININGYRFDPFAGLPALPPGLRLERIPADRPSYHLVQLGGPITVEMRRGLEEAGAAILHYVPSNAYIVRADPGALARLWQLPAVRWSGPFEPAYALSRRLAREHDTVLTEAAERGLAGSAPRERVDTRVSVPVRVLAMERSRIEDIAEGVRALRGVNVQVAPRAGLLRATLPRAALEDLARLPGVLWIDREPDRELLNDDARWVLQRNDAATLAVPVHDHGVRGTGQVVTVADSGIDFEHDAFADPAVPVPGPAHRKVRDYYIPPNTLRGDGSPGGDDHDNGPINHGTHVSGTVAGDAGTWHLYDGDPTEENWLLRPHDGQAFDALLNVQDISNDPQGDFVFPSIDLFDLFQPAFDRGSRIHTNSWGSRGAPDYIDEAARTDEFVWQNPDVLVLFSGGNRGPFAGTLNPFAAAKNVLAVGATGNGALANDLAYSLNNLLQVVYFSSRGPASDGRLKPDLMAPGQDVFSARGCDAVGTCSPNLYHDVSGTSMSAPNAAGSAALVRQYFADGFHPTGTRQEGHGFSPSAALVKATLINGAVQMTGAEVYANGEAFYPNNQQGWGRILLDEALFFPQDVRTLFVDDNRSGVRTRDTVSYRLTAGSSGPLEVTLVWSDHAGLPLTNPNLVNDLDLEVIAPDGRSSYRGNQFITESAAGESRKNPKQWDRLNNVEGVRVKTGVQAGTWTVKVTGANVPMGMPGTGRQPYALVVSGIGLSGRAGIVRLDDDRYTATETARIEVADLDRNLNAGAVETVVASVSSPTEPLATGVTLTETGPGTAVFAGSIALQRATAPVAGDGTLQVAGGDVIMAAYFDADNGRGGSGTVTASAVVDDEPPGTSGVQAMDVRATHATIVWTTGEESDSEVGYGASRPPILGAADGARVTSHRITLTGLSPATRFYFEVRSRDRAGNLAIADAGGAYFRFETPAVAGPLAEWPSFQNTQDRQGRSSSRFVPPLRLLWSDGFWGGDVTRGTVFADGTLYVSTSGTKIKAYDPSTGRVIWSQTPEGISGRSPTVTNGVLYITQGLPNDTWDDYVLARDALTGKTLWTSQAASGLLTPLTLAVDGGRVFTYEQNFRVIAVSATDGSLAWQQATPGVFLYSEVATGGGRLYIGSSTGVVALSQSNGATLWSRNLGDTVSAAPVHANGLLYVVTHGGGRFFALNASTGATIWQASPSLGSVVAPPAFDGSTLYASGVNKRYFAVNAANGQVRWQTPIPVEADSSPAYANGYLYGVARDGVLRILNATTGAIVETHPLFSLSGFTFAHPAIAGGRVFVTDDAGTTSAFEGTRADADGDGDPDDTDCAPTDPSAHHGATEFCNGVDDDCVSGPDDGLDADGDGVSDCLDADDDNDGIPDAQDCAPLSSQVHPGAAEACNTVDDDCDGLVDEGWPDTDADGTRDCLDADDDNDGFPDLQDCAPADARINPAAPEAFSSGETCFDLLDNDCDGAADLDCAVEASVQTVVTGTATGALVDIRSTSPDDTHVRLTESGSGAKKRLTAIWTFPGTPAGVQHDLRFEGYRNGNANDNFSFGVATRSGSCDVGGTYAPTPLTVTRTDSDGDLLSSAAAGAASIAAPLFCVRLTDSGDDSRADSVWVDRLYLFPVPGVPLCADADGDGYPATCQGCNHLRCPTTDCNDADARAVPGGTEGPGGTPSCADASDNDCDGLADRQDAACQTSEDPLVPNGDRSVQWRLNGQTQPPKPNFPAVDEGFPANDGEDYIFIPTSSPGTDLLDFYDLSPTVLMDPGSRTTTLEVRMRAWTTPGVKPLDRFPIGITLFVDDLERGETVLEVPPDNAWHTLVYRNPAWDAGAWTKSQIDSMILRLRGRVELAGQPHDVSLWVSAVEVTVRAPAP